VRAFANKAIVFRARKSRDLIGPKDLRGNPAIGSVCALNSNFLSSSHNYKLLIDL
jgi:hypothetical protein